MKATYVQRNYKDTLFRMLFREKENPNMPLRELFYVTKILQERTRDADLYGRKLIKIPTPRFVVFYNGINPLSKRQTMRLSDAFEKRQVKPELELMVTVYNINRGQNPELMEACRLLREYAEYVERVRKYAREMPFAKAVERAVDECIRERVLAEFLAKNRTEAIEMSIFEYDEEKHMKHLQKEAEERLAQLLKILIDNGRNEDVNRVLSDSEYREQLYQENNL